MYEKMNELIAISIDAGKEIMDIYQHSNVEVKKKDDNSPITIADRRAHEVICKGLAKLNSDIPVLSEESAKETFEERKAWGKYWMVDPLDGTKEFINRTDEFTVNIALIEGQASNLGVVYLPCTGEVFYADRASGAFRSSAEKGNPQKIAVANSKSAPRCLVSRSHAGKEQEGILKTWPDAKIVPAGSSLKFCRIAEGSADVYLRKGPTMEWDTAAGQCVLETAGGIMHRLDGEPFTYHKDELLNPGFVALSSQHWSWQDLM